MESSDSGDSTPTMAEKKKLLAAKNAQSHPVQAQHPCQAFNVTNEFNLINEKKN